MPSDYAYADGYSVRSTIATIGDPQEPLTCSMAAAKRTFPGSEVIGCETFEDLQRILQEGEADFGIVPAAFTGISKWLMKPQVMPVKRAFVFPIPALVLCVQQRHDTKKSEVLYYVSATYGLIETIQGVDFDVGVQVATNVHSARRLLGHTESNAAGCITNQLVADRFNLRVHQVLRPQTNMPFVVFGSAKRGGLE